MSKTIITQSNFSSGAVTPRLHSRIDSDVYARALETLTNGLVTAQGSVKRRNGSKFVSYTKTQNVSTTRLLKYQLDKDTEYVIEAGQNYFRFYKNGSQVTESAKNITGITQANPAVITSNAHGYSNGDYVYINSVAGMTEINSNDPYIVANKTTNTFELTDLDNNAINSSGFTAYSSGGTATKIYQLTTTYDTTELQTLQYVQKGTTLYMAQPDNLPRQMYRNGSDTDWVIEDIPFNPQPTYATNTDINVAATLDATSGTSVLMTLTNKHIDLTDGSTYQWTANGSFAGVFYVSLSGGGDPSITNPTKTYLSYGEANYVAASASLQPGDWSYGDYDSLGYSTIYVRWTDGSDPDSLAAESVTIAYSGGFTEGDIGRTIQNTVSGEAGKASIVSINTLGQATLNITETFTDTSLAAGEWEFTSPPNADLQFDETVEGSVASVTAYHNLGRKSTNEYAISAVNKSITCQVTLATGGYELRDGDYVYIDDVTGMTELNRNTYRITNINSTMTTFNLESVDSTNYVTYVSGGTVRKLLTNTKIAPFRSADEGKYILANGGVIEITGVASGNAAGVIVKSLNSSDRTGTWTLEEETWSSTRGYPKAVGYFEQRLIFGGTDSEPETLWFSDSGLYERFGVGPDDEDSIQIDLVSDKLNSIQWISTSRDLIVGTTSDEFSVNSASQSALSPSSIRTESRTNFGSEGQQAVRIGNEVLFVQRNGTKIRSYKYDFQTDGYVANELSVLAQHLLEDGIKELAYAKEPDNVLFAVLNNGKMATATYDRENGVLAWSEFDTDGDYESVQAINNGTSDEVWVIVERTVGSSTRRCVEVFIPGTGEDDVDGFSDSYLTLSNNLVISNITAANPGVVTSTSHGLTNGDTVIIKDLVDPFTGSLDSSKTNMSDLNGGIYTVANATTNTFELSGVDTSGYNAYGSGGNAYLRVSTVSGLEHLEGKTVQVKGDGAVQVSQVVTNGAITLSQSAGEVTVGLPFTTTIKTLSHIFSIGLGNMQGQRTRWVRPQLQVYRSTNPLVNGEYLPSRNGAQLGGQKVPLSTGYLEYGPLNWTNNSKLTITVSDPLPLELTGITGTADGGIK